jgi:hypothetical protein
MQIRPLGAKVYADRRTDMEQTDSFFCNFANVPQSTTHRRVTLFLIDLFLKTEDSEMRLSYIHKVTVFIHLSGFQKAAFFLHKL